MSDSQIGYRQVQRALSLFLLSELSLALRATHAHTYLIDSRTLLRIRIEGRMEDDVSIKAVAQRRTYMHTHVCMHVCIHICMYVCMYVCVFVCVYVCRHLWMYVSDMLTSIYACSIIHTYILGMRYYLSKMMSPVEGRLVEQAVAYNVYKHHSLQ